MNLLETYKNINCLSDKESYHHYISKFYNELFTPIKQDKISLLEIGAQYGHSLKLWECFFENAKIYSLDIINVLQHDFSEKVITMQGNAYSTLCYVHCDGVDTYGPIGISTESLLLSLGYKKSMKPPFNMVFQK